MLFITIKNFSRIMEFLQLMDDAVAQCYLSKNCWSHAQAVREFFHYKDIFPEWEISRIRLENPTQLQLESDQDSMPFLSASDDKLISVLIILCSYYCIYVYACILFLCCSK